MNESRVNQDDDEREVDVDLDQQVCICFHVTRRKIEKFIRLEKPVRPGQLSECFGAGTGCGWCRTFLEQLFQSGQQGRSVNLPSAKQYALMRAAFRVAKRESGRQSDGPEKTDHT